MTELPEHVVRNRALWDDWAQKYVASGERRWARGEPVWGEWSVPESDVGMLPDDLAAASRQRRDRPVSRCELRLRDLGVRGESLGRLAFLVNSFLLMLCMPAEDDVAATDRLLRPAFGLYRVEWPGNSGVEFHLSHGDWIRLLRRAGFDVEDLVEVRPPAEASTRYPFVTLEWARQWPCEEVWKARKR